MSNTPTPSKVSHIWYYRGYKNFAIVAHEWNGIMSKEISKMLGCLSDVISFDVVDNVLKLKTNHGLREVYVGDWLTYDPLDVNSSMVGVCRKNNFRLWYTQKAFGVL